MRAPIFSNGSAIRLIGRRLSDASVEGRNERTAGKNTGEKPHRRAGIPAIDNLLRRREAFPSFAFDGEQAIVAADLDAERPERLDRAVVVLAAGEIGDAARSEEHT